MKQPQLQQRLDEFTTKLRKRGFYEATASTHATISEDKKSVDLTIAVRSGPAVTVRYEGDPLPADRLKELVPVERESSATEDLLEDSIVAIRDYLRQQGTGKATPHGVERKLPTRCPSSFKSRRACGTTSPSRSS